MTKHAFSSLVTAEIETKVGDRYVFPAVEAGQVMQALPTEETVVSAPTITLANASISVLSVPVRIVKNVLVDGKVVWSAPLS